VAREYSVGKGKPPLHTRFQKGQSGNPRGRCKGSKNVATLFAQVLNERVTVTENGKRRTITKREAILKQLANKAASGDYRAMKLVILLADTADICGEEHKSQAEIDADIAKRIDLFTGAYQWLADRGVPMPQTREPQQVDTTPPVPSLNGNDDRDRCGISPVTIQIAAKRSRACACRTTRLSVAWITR
jgi:Family of unknown function (DUF5681)